MTNGYCTLRWQASDLISATCEETQPNPFSAQVGEQHGEFRFAPYSIRRSFVHVYHPLSTIASFGLHYGGLYQ